MNPLFWKDKKVLLTGHTGFKGGWLSLWLNAMGAKVVGYSLEPPTEPSLFDVAQVQKSLAASYIEDIRDLNNMLLVFNSHKPDIVFHMAAQPLVRYSYVDPIETYSTNVMGTVNMFEAVRKTESVRVVVNVTSDKCYENREWLWGYRENEPMGGYDPYSNSKGCAELVTSAYRHSFFNPNIDDAESVAIATGRAGNVIGGGDWADDRLVPDIFKAILNKNTTIIRNPNAIRPWQHVLEPLNGYLTLAEKMWDNPITYSDAWNFGPNEDDTKPVSWIIQNLVELWGEGSEWKVDAKTDHPHEATYLKLDCSKAKSMLGWEPRWNIEIALSKVVEWYQEYQSGNNMYEVTLKQINEYSKTTS